MVYANDQWVQLPVRDLYDTQVMAMAINAAKDMYEKGQQEMKDFQKEYGDFLTPIMADQDWYNQNVTGRVRDAVNALYAQGIDPLRNAQGRAIISQLINNMPYGEIAKLRTSADAAKEYIKNRGILEAAGKYNKDLEERYLGYDINGWDTLNNGVWNRTSPTEMKTLKELTESWYNSRTARDLTEEDLKNAKIPYDPRYKYSGYLDSDILNVARGNTPGWNDTVYSNYYRDLARQQLQRAGIENPSDTEVEAVLQRNIADANQEWLINPTKTPDKFAEMAQQQAYARELENLRHAHDMDEIDAKAKAEAAKKGEKEDDNGNYLHLISNATSGARGAFSNQMLSEFSMKNPKAAASNFTELAQLQQKLISETDPTKAQKIKTQIDNLGKKMQRQAMGAFLTRKNEDGKTTPYSIIMSLGEGQSGVYALNDILKNRSIEGDVELDDALVLSRSGYNAPDEKGWSSPSRKAGRILSPHQLMTNILKYESGNGVKLKTKSGKIITQDDLIKKIEESAENEGFWQASTNARLSRTDKVQSLHEYISAPDENGNYHVYMKVAIQQGARLTQPGSWLPQGEHDGFWVETNIKQLPDGTLATESNPSVFGAGLRQRKDFTNAASDSEYGNIRW